MIPLLVLRPEPGAAATARRARALGLDPIVAPLFAIAPCDWTAPDPARFDALLLTSANAARHAGAALAGYAALPLYTIGAATAAAARAAGLAVAHVGDDDATAVLAAMARDGRSRALHLTGEAHRAASHPAVSVTRIAVYAAAPAAALPPAAAQAARDGAVALLHSPRAAALFARLLDAAAIDRGRVALAAISPAAAAEAGEGWRAIAVAAAPDDDLLLAKAARLCESGG